MAAFFWRKKKYDKQGEKKTKQPIVKTKTNSKKHNKIKMEHET